MGINKDPKYKIGETVCWKYQRLVIQGIRDYQGYCWVYDFFPNTNTVLPFHFTGIPEAQISLISNKKWWQFWRRP